jgi:LPS export ABC transporter protein LptC
MRLDTAKLFTAPDDDRYWTDAPVRMTSGGSRMDAIGMDFNNITRHMELGARVVGVFPPRREP